MKGQSFSYTFLIQHGLIQDVLSYSTSVFRIVRTLYSVDLCFMHFLFGTMAGNGMLGRYCNSYKLNPPLLYMKPLSFSFYLLLHDCCHLPL